MQLLGTVRLPEQPPNEDEELRRKPSEKRCELYAVGDAELSSGGSTVVGICNEAVPPERAFTWAKTLLERVETDLVVVEVTMPVCIKPETTSTFLCFKIIGWRKGRRHCF